MVVVVVVLLECRALAVMMMRLATGECGTSRFDMETSKEMTFSHLH